MKVWPFSGALLLVLAACCPAPLAAQPTAFRGVVVGVSPEGALHLEQRPGTPLLTLVVPENGVHAATGEQLPLTALQAGDTVYVQGRVRNGEVQVAEVQKIKVRGTKDKGAAARVTQTR